MHEASCSTRPRHLGAGNVWVLCNTHHILVTIHAYPNEKPLLSYIINHIAKKHTGATHKITEKRTNRVCHPVTADL